MSRTSHPDCRAIVTLIGNLGAEPDIRFTQDGKPIANLSIATSESWQDKRTGERAQRTEWHRVVIFSEGLARVAEKYLHKGSKVYVEGQLKTRKWQDNDGIDRYTTEIVVQGFNTRLVMLDGPKRNGKNGQTAEETPSEAETEASAEDESEMPF